MLIVKYTIVDAFTSQSFSGNPAAVITFEEGQQMLQDSQLQQIAAEFNLSETAFLTPSHEASADDVATYLLRWFMPSKEVKLCGHATLASAAILFSTLTPNVKVLHFKTLSGILRANRVPGSTKIELELPSVHLSPIDADEHAIVSEVVCKAVGRSVKVHGAQQAEILRYIVVHIDKDLDLAEAKINHSAFMTLTNHDVVILTSDRPSVSNPSARFISRTFAPKWGVPEDPVCGSAHCLLMPYWSSVLGVEDGAMITTRVVSPRGGDLDLIWDKKAGLVKLRGDSVVTARGELYL